MSKTVDGRMTAKRGSPKNIIKLKKHDFPLGGSNLQGFHAPEWYKPPRMDARAQNKMSKMEPSRPMTRAEKQRRSLSKNG